MENLNNLSYKTYITDTVDAVINCNKLLLFYYTYDEYDNNKITLDNLQSFYKEVINSNKKHSYLILSERVEDSDKLSYFDYQLSDAKLAGINSGFNIIIYLNSNSTPVGYTEFQEIIGIASNLNIYISLTSKVTENDSVVINFLLDSVTDNLTTTKNFIGDKLYEYTSSSTYFNNLNKVCGKYTSSVVNMLNNPKSIIYQQSQFIKDGEIYKLNLLKNRDIDPFNVGFDNFYIGKYGEDIALYEWLKVDNTTIKYCIYSLTKKTKFSGLKQYIHTKSNDGYLIIPNMTSTTKTTTISSLDILYASGRFLICQGTYSDNTTEIKLLNTEAETPYWMELDSNFICIPENTEKCDYIHLNQSKINSTTASTEEILEKIPDLFSTFLNTKELLSYSIKRCIGDWYLLYKNSASGSIYYLTNKSMSLYLDEDDLSKLIIINNNTILLKEDDYYIMYNYIGKSFYTERSRAKLKNCFLIKNNKGILFASSGDNSDGDYSDKTYINYYDKEIIKIIPKDNELKDTYLNNFRRNSYPYSISGIPNIIGALDGIIFYINNNKINYL